jgi:hypothetical protein
MKDIGGNALVIKEININLVRKALKATGPATKQQLAEETGLSLVTVGTALNSLKLQNEVFEYELSPSRGGRPAQQYLYNNAFAHALIVFPYEIDGRIAIRSTIVDMAGISVNTFDTTVEFIDIKIFERIIGPLLCSFPTIQAIGFGNPGVDKNGLILLSDYPGLVGTHLTEYFSTLYKVPVILENDVNAAVIGFTSRCKLPEDSILAYLYFPDRHPPGAGIFVNGKLLRGKSNFAGEISRIPLDVVWNDNLYSSADLFSEAVTRLIITICGVLNPDSIILNGDFLSEAYMSAIAQRCAAHLPQNILPSIQLSESFISDYQSGLTVQTLAQLEPDIRLARKNHSEV